MPSTRQLLAKQSTNRAAKIAFDVTEHRRHNSTSDSSKHSLDSSLVGNGPVLTFEDNIKVEEFLKMYKKNTFQFRVNLKQFDPVQALKLPYVFEGVSLRRMKPEEGPKIGFWSKLLLNGSSQPIARENATMMPLVENGQLVLYIFGGSPMITGQFMFDVYKVNPSAKTWAKVASERPIIQTLGSRPVFKKDEKTSKFAVYSFSGMVPLQRINSGVKVCPPDLNQLDSAQMRWQRIKNQSSHV